MYHIKDLSDVNFRLEVILDAVKGKICPIILLFFYVHGSVRRKRIFKYNQRDATSHNLFVSVKRSTCFRLFLRPSSGAQKLSIQHRVLCHTFTATCHDSGR